MKRICFIILVVGFATFGIGACGKPPPMTLSDFRWECNMAGRTGGTQLRDGSDGGPTGCDPFAQAEICRGYSSRIEAFSGTLDECLQMCRDASAEMYSQQVYHWTCQEVANQVATTCTLYCRRNYQ
ncbi:hypothetical protein dsat_0430 [Alkalidesulfovibrio alkalitolerans DSM 16529]|jgi:hypothetical protein|uniref:Lipoprotein n=1 Tax=Alkalidesulfovibrio alkalitolerans DSM 16529 TaxID=1121439 RepID=S7UGM8_9BACT|nr:hypothetical protein [Alkalidesulfovibrio alkalitolerans]EPR32989.1 hypothetical protein dsat_0430 [Alkalidesulfovibrio alkalitolerans DSM 16529]